MLWGGRSGQIPRSPTCQGQLIKRKLKYVSLTDVKVPYAEVLKNVNFKPVTQVIKSLGLFMIF